MKKWVIGVIGLVILVIIGVFIVMYIKKECEKNVDCESNQECFKNKCVNLTCEECQYISNHTCIDYMCCTDEDCGFIEECDMITHTCQRLVPTRTEEVLENCPLLESVFAQELKLKPEEIEIGLKYGTLPWLCQNDPSTNESLKNACKWDIECCLDLPDITDTGSAQDFVKKFFYCFYMEYMSLGPGAPPGPVKSIKVTISNVSKLKRGYIIYTVSYPVTVKESTAVEETPELRPEEGWTYLSNSGCVLFCLGKE